jgi:dihydropyrimidinase
VNAGVLGEIPGIVEAGVSSFHLRLDGHDERHINDSQLLEFLQCTTAAGAVACLHAENGEIIDLFLRRLVAEGKTLPKFIAAARPPEVEAQATARAISIAEMAKAPIYFTSPCACHRKLRRETRTPGMRNVRNIS